MKHTPGPWNIRKTDYNGGTTLRVLPTLFEATFHITTNPKFAERDARIAADAKLIASAPVLLETLQEFVERIEQGDFDKTFLKKAKAAIEKATGE